MENLEIEPARQQVQVAGLVRRVLLTIAILCGYTYLGRWVTIPGLDPAALGYLQSLLDEARFSGGSQKFGIFSLGILPFVTGFLLTEIFAVVVPAGRRLRRGGAAGRAKLNAFAFRVSLLVLVVQAAGACKFLARITSPSGLPLLPPGPGSFLLASLTLIASGIVTFLLAESISRWGFGNGFCWLLLLTPFLYFLRMMRESMATLGKPSAELLSLGAPTVLLILVLAAVFVLRSGRFELEGSEEMILKSRTPPFPQGVGPIVVTVALVQYLNLGVGPWIGAQVVGVCVFSLLGYYFFSSRQRVDENLEPLAAVTREGASVLVRQAWKATAVLLAILLIFALDAVATYEGLGSKLSAAYLLMLMAFAIDLAAEARFLLRHSDTVPVLELDNPHLAGLLQNELEQRSIPAQVRTLQYRQLFFFLQPLVKMHLMVPASREPEARRMIEGMELRTL